MILRPLAVVVIVLGGGIGLAAWRAPDRGEVTGTVRTADGSSAAGALVTVRPEGATFTHTVIADANGTFRLPGVGAGTVEVTAGYGGTAGPAQTLTISETAVARIELEAAPPTTGRSDLPASSLLALLPDGEEKRRFIRDCTNCHVFDARIAYPQGAPRAHASWSEAVARMLSFSGPQSAFPVIAEGREPGPTADWLTTHVTADAQPAPPPRADAAAAGAIVTEYIVPAATDLPHDVAITDDGRVLVTGMFTHRMYILDPETGTFDTEPIPVPNANPRAVEVGPDGAWWVVLGGPNALARRSTAGEWQSWNVATYPHSLALDDAGRVWYNGHFTSDPEVVGWLEPETGDVTPLAVPVHPDADVGAGPIPYELRTGPDGRIWGSELVGDRIFAYDPATSRFQVWPMPLRDLAPRRLDIDPQGIVWIPEFAGGHLTRFDPATGEFRRIATPVADASPYVARVDTRTGRVWVGTGNADAIFAYDPGPQTWTTYPLPSRATLVRHLAVDPRNGDLWIAYGASPGPAAKVARLRAR